MTERNSGSLPPEEEAAWARIVAGYHEDAARHGESDGEHPGHGEEHDGPEPDGDTLTKPRPGSGTSSSSSGHPGTPAAGDGNADPDDGVRSYTVYAAGTGPRDWVPQDEDQTREDEDEGHFVPPEPPPLPETDVTTKFAWIAVLGGPLLLFGTVLLQQPLQWWIVTLGVGGFLGGFGTLVARMRDDGDDDDWEDPGRGAVV